MRLLLLLALLSQAPATQAPARIQLEIRVFDGAAEVSGETRVTVYRAGDRAEPVAQLAGRKRGVEMTVSEGIYDAQAIRERDGRVVSIRWAERLVVMPYPDEAGRHLEVVNFTAGFGALQIRAKEGAMPEVAVFPQGAREQAIPGQPGRGYVLYIVPAGRYDIRSGTSEVPLWHTVDVPLDRTRLWIVPQGATRPGAR